MPMNDNVYGILKCCSRNDAYLHFNWKKCYIPQDFDKQVNAHKQTQQQHVTVFGIAAGQARSP